jgi:glycine/D-amino acid oxidase-like deaminating enzyme
MRAKGSKLWASALAEAQPTPYWTDRPERPSPVAPLTSMTTAQLAIIGGGCSGLWTALQALERDPSADVALLESGVCGHAASGRNGGFCPASLTHGPANGADRFPDEIGELERLGGENLDEIEQTLRRHGIDCGFFGTAYRGRLAYAAGYTGLGVGVGSSQPVATHPGLGRPRLRLVIPPVIPATPIRKA